MSHCVIAIGMRVPSSCCILLFFVMNQVFLNTTNSSLCYKRIDRRFNLVISTFDICSTQKMHSFPKLKTKTIQGWSWVTVFFCRRSCTISVCASYFICAPTAAAYCELSPNLVRDGCHRNTGGSCTVIEYIVGIHWQLYWRLDSRYDAICIFGNAESEKATFFRCALVAKCLGMMNEQSAWCDLSRRRCWNQWWSTRSTLWGSKSGAKSDDDGRRRSLILNTSNSADLTFSDRIDIYFLFLTLTLTDRHNAGSKARIDHLYGLQSYWRRQEGRE